MSFLQYIFILFIVILTNEVNTSTIDIESTTESISVKVAAEILRIETELKRDEEQLKTDREKLEEEKIQMQQSIKKTSDVFSLNVGGEIMMTTRETLTHIPKSIFSIMFNGRWEHKLETDQNGNIFFDFDPILFRHLLDQLQLLNPNHLYPPSQPSLTKPFQKMIHKLGLQQELSLEKNIIHFNVGGQLITNQRTTFTQRSNSTCSTIASSSNITIFDDKSDTFVDYHPKLFRHLVKQLREKPFKDIRSLKAPSHEDESSFKRMLNDSSIFRQLFSSTPIDINTTWKKDSLTIAGGNGRGDQLNQLHYPHGIYINDDDQSIYIADWNNHRIVEWKCDAKNNEVVAGGNGKGNRMNQLNEPSHVIVDKMNDSLIICDRGNKRVVRWSRPNGTNGQTIISDIACHSLAMDNNENLYISNTEKNEVSRWKIGETEGTIVAGGNGKGNNLTQLNIPVDIFVDKDYSVYVADDHNHRVMKWVQGAKEGIVVAGGQGHGSSLRELYYPNGVVVDQMGNVYVTDSWNLRVMRWPPESKEGSIVVDGMKKREQPNPSKYLRGLSFDRRGNLYVTDVNNHRIQKFDRD